MKLNEVSVIIPVKGDKKVSRVVQSVLNQGMDKCEIFVLRNSHISYEIEEDYPCFTSSPYYSIDQVLLLCFGKAKTLNYGIKHAKYDFVVIVDADCILDSDAFSIALNYFQDDSVFAVGGKLEVLPHRLNILSAVQMIEYDKAFNISRRFFNWINCNYIISGAFGVFRKDALLSIGGYDENTVGEDLELILRIRRLCRGQKCSKIIFDPNIVCFTEAPRTLRALIHQRERWQRGFIDAIIKNKEMLFNKKYGLLGLIVLPCICFEAFIGPIAIILGSSGLLDGAFSSSLLFVYITYQVLLSLISRSFEKIQMKLIPFIIKCFIINVFGVCIQIIISFARLFGTVFFKMRRMKW